MKIETHWVISDPPETEPVDVETAKKQARIEIDDEDELIEQFLIAARRWVEEYTGRSLMRQAWSLELSGFADRIWLPRAAPLADATVDWPFIISYYDQANVLQELDAAVYSVLSNQEPASVELAAYRVWPPTMTRTDAVQIVYPCGADAPEAVEPALRQAIVRIVAEWFENREQGDIPQAAIALCAPFRVAFREPVCA